MTQKAILTFTDSDDERVDVSLTFDPPVKGDAPMTGAMHFAIRAMKAINSASEDDSDDE